MYHHIKAILLYCFARYIFVFVDISELFHVSPVCLYSSNNPLRISIHHHRHIVSRLTLQVLTPVMWFTQLHMTLYVENSTAEDIPLSIPIHICQMTTEVLFFTIYADKTTERVRLIYLKGIISTVTFQEHSRCWFTLYASKLYKSSYFNFHM